jgi:hypothetical protein
MKGKTGSLPALLLVTTDPWVEEIYGELFRRRGYHVVDGGDTDTAFRILRERRDIRVAVVALGAASADARERLTRSYPSLVVHLAVPENHEPIDCFEDGWDDSSAK